MRKLWFVTLLLGSFLLAQESNPSNPSQSSPKTSKGEITVQGCVGRSTGDYILTKPDPGMTYQLQATRQNKTRPLPGTTSGSDRKGITLAENELQLLSKDGSGLGSFNHHLDQDHREGMLRPIANLA